MTQLICVFGMVLCKEMCDTVSQNCCNENIWVSSVVCVIQINYSGLPAGLVSPVRSVSGLALGSSQVQFSGPALSFTNCQSSVKG